MHSQDELMTERCSVATSELNPCVEKTAVEHGVASLTKRIKNRKCDKGWGKNPRGCWRHKPSGRDERPGVSGQEHKNINSVLG